MTMAEDEEHEEEVRESSCQISVWRRASPAKSPASAARQAGCATPGEA